MPNLRFTMTGNKAVLNALKKLGNVVPGRVLAKATRAGMRPIHAEAKQNVPVDTGKLKKSIKLRAMKMKRRTSKGARVFHSGKDFRGDPKGYYGAFVEYGTSRNKAKPHMRPAYDQKKQAALSITEAEIRQGIEREAKKIP